MINHLLNGFNGEMEKIAEESSWWEKQKGAVRASTKGRDLGGIIGIADPKLIKSRLKKGGKYALRGGAGGAVSGAGVGALLGKKFGRGKAALIGSGIGGLLGAVGGFNVGGYKADKEHLAKKGITVKNLGWSHKYTPKAEKEYILKHRKK